MKPLIVSFIVGFIFSIGLGVSGMTQPQKVIGFLDPVNWDPSLLFVMISAVGLHAIVFPFIRRRNSPVLDIQWHISTRKDIAPRLIFGSAIFGIGWGLGGFCPGPAITSIFSGDIRVVVFVSMMLFGMFISPKEAVK